MISRPVSSFFLRADSLLRGRPALRPIAAAGARPGALPHLLLMTLVFGSFYGAVMGVFGGLHDGRWPQLIYSALKVPMLLLVSFCISLPSFFVLNTIVGARSDFRQVLHALIASQAGLTVVLASLAPFTAFWYVSYGDYDAALMFNAAMFFVATLAGQWMLRRSYRPLTAANPRHRHLLRSWLALYAFVAIQMAWVLRPFVGHPHAPVSFFRSDAWGNAYVELAHIAARALGW